MASRPAEVDDEKTVLSRRYCSDSNGFINFVRANEVNESTE